MEYLLDEQPPKKIKHYQKIINLFCFLLVIVFLLITLYIIWFDSRLILSPFVPKYTVVYLNSWIINTLIITLGGLIPALYLRIKKKHLWSSICIALFFIAGLSLGNHIFIYKHFYWLAHYL